MAFPDLDSLAQKTLLTVMQHYATPQPYRTLSIFDRETHNYLLMDEGWEKYRRVHRVSAHIEIKGEKIWIHEDSTEEGIANLLLKDGLPQSSIVLAFHDPVLREASQFAVA